MYNQRMQLPDSRIVQAPADPAQHAAIRVTGDPAQLAWLKRRMHLGTGGCEIGPGLWCLVMKAGNERFCGLLDDCCIIRLKVNDLHASVPAYDHPVVPFPGRRRCPAWASRLPAD